MSGMVQKGVDRFTHKMDAVQEVVEVHPLYLSCVFQNVKQVLVFKEPGRKPGLFLGQSSDRLDIFGEHFRGSVGLHLGLFSFPKGDGRFRTRASLALLSD